MSAVNFCDILPKIGPVKFSLELISWFSWKRSRICVLRVPWPGVITSSSLLLLTSSYMALWYYCHLEKFHLPLSTLNSLEICGILVSFLLYLYFLRISFILLLSIPLVCVNSDYQLYFIYLHLVYSISFDSCWNSIISSKFCM